MDETSPPSDPPPKTNSRNASRKGPKVKSVRGYPYVPPTANTLMPQPTPEVPALNKRDLEALTCKVSLGWIYVNLVDTSPKDFVFGRYNPWPVATNNVKKIVNTMTKDYHVESYTNPLKMVVNPGDLLSTQQFSKDYNPATATEELQLPEACFSERSGQIHFFSGHHRYLTAREASPTLSSKFAKTRDARQGNKLQRLIKLVKWWPVEVFDTVELTKANIVANLPPHRLHHHLSRNPDPLPALKRTTLEQGWDLFVQLREISVRDLQTRPDPEWLRGQGLNNRIIRVRPL
ncbi:hypothetical protein BDM02DRAFT_3192053 [Thelephora ganbajun]|uniref:Uncharacterized protein n=1 Tax=Thelephora ganbajun TaxID=370292 RepID=A0ACB6Z188_THEGA|nr:hypothetical protein BDM02DRAFT_3192053 [Thelephora ganbajun]